MFVPDTNHLYSIVVAPEKNYALLEQFHLLLSKYEGQPFDRISYALFAEKDLQKLASNYPHPNNEACLARLLPARNGISKNTKAEEFFCFYRDEELVGFSFLTQRVWGICIKKSFEKTGMAGFFAERVADKIGIDVAGKVKGKSIYGQGFAAYERRKRTIVASAHI